MPRSYEKYRSYKGTVGKIAPNILNRNFQAEKPTEKNGLRILQSLNYWERSFIYHKCWIYLMVKLSFNCFKVNLRHCFNNVKTIF